MQERAQRRARARTASLGAAIVLGCALAPQAGAQGQPTLSGRYSASSMREVWSTTSWGEACGPKPTSSGGAPGGMVEVVQQGGELTISGAGRPWSTTQCWEMLPGSRRVAHSGGQRGWSSRCESAPGDPRRSTVQTTTTATDDTIVFQETGVFEFAIAGTTCRATVGRSRSFKLVQRAGEAPAAAPATSASVAPPSEAASAASSAVSPPVSTAARRPVERPSALAPSEGYAALAEPRPPDAGEAPGVASSLVEAVLGGSSTRAEDAARQRRRIFVLTVSGFALALAVAALALYRRGRRRRAERAPPSARPSIAPTIELFGPTSARRPMRCSVCGRDYPPGAGGFCHDDGAPLRPAPTSPELDAERSPIAEEPATSPPASSHVATESLSQRCPSCGKRYPDGASFCGEDGSRLAPIH